MKYQTAARIKNLENFRKELFTCHRLPKASEEAMELCLQAIDQRVGELRRNYVLQSQKEDTDL